MGWGFIVSVMNTLNNTIFQVSLSYQLDELCLQGDTNTEHEVSSQVSLQNSLFKNIFWVQWPYQVLSPGDLNNQCAGLLLHSFNCFNSCLYMHYNTNMATILHIWATQPLQQMGTETKHNCPCLTTVPTATASSHIFAKYVPETNM